MVSSTATRAACPTLSCLSAAHGHSGFTRLLAAGFARYGAKTSTAAIFDGVMRAAAYMDDRRIPELYCGFHRRRGRGPVLYPAACSPQAWSASAPFSIIEALLGLEFYPEQRELRLNNPVLPPSMASLTIRNVRLGDAAADFVVRASGASPTLEVIRARGDIRISLCRRSSTA